MNTLKGKSVRGLTLAERIEALSIPEPNTGCWLWVGNWNPGGYGTISITIDKNKYRPKLAHREAYKAFKGPIPPGMYVCHTCDVRCCVNPEHLWLGTIDENNKDKMMKGRCRSLQGEDCPTSKLTHKDVVDIRASKESDRTLATKYGVAKSLIFRVKKRKSWSHIP